MIIMKFASYHVYPRVGFRKTFICDSIFNCSRFSSRFSMTDIRGFEQEVSLVTKKGVEARSYDGVSLIWIERCQFVCEKLMKIIEIDV